MGAGLELMALILCFTDALIILYLQKMSHQADAFIDVTLHSGDGTVIQYLGIELPYESCRLTRDICGVSVSKLLFLPNYFFAILL